MVLPMNEEERFDFEQKHEEDLQRLRGFRLLDDDFMSKVFEDKNCVEFLLQIILKRTRAFCSFGYSRSGSTKSGV